MFPHIKVHLGAKIDDYYRVELGLSLKLLEGMDVDMCLFINY